MLRRGYGSAINDIVWSVALVCLAGAFVGSRLFHVVDHWSDYAARPLDALAVWTGGASVIGGILGGITAGVAFVAWRRLPVGVGIDAAGLALPWGMAIGRVGDLINGEHWSTACGGVPWCIRYTHPATFGQRELVHPAVGYELVLDLLIAAIVYAAYVRSGRRLGSGALMFAFLALYGVARFFVTFFRIDAPVHFGLALAQWTAVLFVAAGLAGLTLRRAYPER